MKTLAVLALMVATLACAWAQSHYVHRKLDWFTDVPWVRLMDNGTILYGGTKDDPELTYKTCDLYLDGENYTADMFVGRHKVVGARYEADGNLWFHAYFYDPEGKWIGHAFRNKTDYVAENWGMAYESSYWEVNARGDVAIMLSVDPNDGNAGYDLWLNDRNITLETFGPDRFRFGAPGILFETGDMFWTGSSPGWSPMDVYLNGSNLSEQILGPGRTSSGVLANSPSDYVFMGASPITDGHQNIFKGTENYGARIFGSVQYEGALRGYTKEGRVVWFGQDRDPTGPRDLYIDDVNLSSFLGSPRDFGEGRVSVSDDGRVMWEAWAQSLGLFPYDMDVFVDQTNISGPRLGWDPTRRGNAGGFTSNGRAVWMGYTAKHGWNVFLDDVNVTENAFEGVPGTRRISHMGFSANARGDVLWLARTNNYYAPWEVWYSELVPEPSALWTLLVPLFLRMRRTRCTGE